MNKRITLLAVIAFSYITSVSAAGTIALVWLTKLNETMIVGDVQHVRTKEIHIKKEYDNNSMSVIEVSQKDPNKWTITALNPGKVDVIIHKSISGSKTKWRKCHHTITVKKLNDKKPFEKNKNSKEGRKERKRKQEKK